MKTRITIILMCLTITISSCWSVRTVGRLNMVSVRNIDSKTEYKLLQKNSEYTFKEAKLHGKGTIEDAVDEMVKRVNGGEYVMNAKISLMTRQGLFLVKSYYVVEGDVWGK